MDLFIGGSNWPSLSADSLLCLMHTGKPMGVAVSQNLVSDSANPHCMSDPLPQSFVGSSYNWTALNLDSEWLSRGLT